MTDQKRALTTTDRQQSALATPGRGSGRRAIQQVIIQQTDDYPAQYQTGKSRGQMPAPINLPKMPAVLSLTLAAIISISFLVAASMFSISLTAYSNSIDRIDRDRSFMRVEQ